MLRPGEEFSVAFANMQKSRVDAVIIQPSLLRKGIAELALKHRLPSFSQARQFAASGGLMSYGPSFAELLRETAVYVDKDFERQQACGPSGSRSKPNLIW